jgi:signal transduction histidine kinase
MDHEYAMRVQSAQPRPDRSAPLLLKGRLLTVVRATWLLIVPLSVGLFLAGVPFRYQQLMNACVGTQCVPGQLSPEAALALENMGFSLAQYATYDITLAVTLMIAYASVAFVIFWRRSREWMALLASLWLVTFGTNIIVSLALAESQPLLQSLVEFLDQLGWAFLLPLFLLTFPDGRFTPRWTRWVFFIYAFVGIAGSAIEPFLPNLTANETVGMAAWFSMQLTGVGAQIYRYLRVSDSVQRQQTKWFMFGLLAAVLILFLYSVFSLPGPLNQPVETAVVSIAFLFIPLSLGISILRYRLWDIDLLVNRALIWGMLTAIVIGMYVLIVGGLGALFQSRGSLLPAILATGLIAFLFHSLRQRVQRGVNRLMYGDRAEPYTVLSRLGKRLEATLAPEAVLPTIVETVAQRLKLPYAAVALQEGARLRIAASIGDPVEAPLVLPLTFQGETIGQLICGPRSSGELFKGEERRLLEDIARQAGVALHAVQLTADLQRSRERLVITREEERRRIRRDLHDGLGPVLASQTLKIGSARALLERDPEAVDSLLRQIETDITVALEDIRRLIYNLRPPALDELGLLRAIQQDAPRHQGLNISFDLPPEILELSAAVEVAVYRIVQEALANIVHHARANRASIRITKGAELRLTISDDGQGLPVDYRLGVGLSSMRERAEELGGNFKIISTQGAGTVIEVSLPLREEEV